MKWLKTIPPKLGENKWIKVFAWRPTEVGDYMVWLEWYWTFETFTRISDSGHYAWVENESRREICRYSQGE